MEGPAATELAAERMIDPGDGSASPGNVRRVRRPAAVTILAIVQLVAAAAYGLVLLALLVGGTAALERLVGGEADGGPVIELELATSIVLVGGAGVAALLAAILLLRMHQLGWTLTMLLAGVSLASSIYLWWAQGTTVAIFVIVQIVTVFYLNQRQVRSAFGIGGRQTGIVPDPGRR